MFIDTQTAEIKELLGARKKIVITTHQNPDGDAMGSTLGLYHFLKALKHQVQIITPNAWPIFLSWMPGIDKVLSADLHAKKAEKLIEEADIIFSLDYNALHRTAQLEPLIEKSAAIKILIDHHLQPQDFAAYSYSDSNASSTCEMVFEFIQFLGFENTIDSNAANCLYTGIMTDTGSFRHKSTTAECHKIAGQLIERGADIAMIHQSVYDTNTIERMRLLGYCLSEKLTVLPDFHTSFISLSKEDLGRFGHKKGDTEGIVNYGLGISGMVLSAIFIEHDDLIKISFRSKGDFDVNLFSRNNFGGGGHKNAAGGKSELSLDETITKFIKAVQDHRDELIK
jgi:phosphoesterase RecJ-like protein